MKPNFALNLTHESIGLLHRTSRGWLEIGVAHLDAPDLGDALTYLRRSALGLSPAGFATQLIIPASQILYDRVWAPGPDEAARRAQIRAALDGRTPYHVDDLVFDWTGEGTEVDVAVVARETLEEAEQFAAQYKFNPVAFTALPDAQGFAGSPWFGASRHSRNVLADGETVERDTAPLTIVSRDTLRGDSPRTEPEPEPQPEPEPGPATETAPAADPLPAAEQPPEPQAPEPQAPEPPPSELPPHSDPVEIAPPTEDPPSPDPLPDPAPEEIAPDTAPRPGDAPFIAIDDAEDAPAADPAPIPAFSSRRSAETAPAGPARRDPPPVTGAGASMGASAGASTGSSAGAAPARLSAPPPAARPGKAATTASVAARQAGKALSALVTAPGIAGLGKAKARAAAKPQASAQSAPQPTAQATLQTPAPPPAGARSPAPARQAAGDLSGPFGRNDARRGKPRFLGLILTGTLLLLLALVAAWSSFYLASAPETAPETGLAASDGAPQTAPLAPTAEAPAAETAAETLAETTAESAAEPQADPALAAASDPALPPGVDEEMLADMQDPATLAAPPAPTDLASAAPAPALPGDQAQDEIFLSGMDAPPAEPDALALPRPETRPDTPPAEQLPPPPFGSLFEFDENGRIKPTAEGVVTPDGVLLFAGRPAIVPPARPAALTPPPAEPPLPEEATPPATGTETAGATEAGLDTFAADPTLSEFRPRLRPEGLTPPPGVETGTVTDPVPGDDATLAIPEESRFASPRPRARSQAVVARAAEARRESEAASLAAAAAAETAALEQEQAALAAATEAAVQEAAAAEAAAAAAIANASPLAVAVSRKPAARPRDLSRAVEAAAAAAVRAKPPEPVAEPEPEPEPEQVASAAPAKRTPSPKPEPTVFSAPEADDEPEAPSSAPRTVLKGTVAKQATFVNAINLSKVNLIGVYGTQSKRYALIREANGRYKKVKVGDRVDGGRVEAITSNEVRYQKGGRIVTLAMPKG